MATSGSFNTSAKGSFYCTVSWSRTATDASTYTHTISYTVTAHNTPGNYRSIYDNKLTANGTAYVDVYTSSGTAYYDGGTVASGTFTVTGTDSLSIWFGAGVGSYHGYNIEGSDSWTLDSIPQKAYITRCDNFNSDSNPYMEFSNPGGLACNLRLEFGGTSISRTSSGSGAYTFSLTTAERNLLYSKCASDNSLTVRYVVATKVNGTETWWSYYDRTMYVIDYTPTFSTFTYKDTGSVSTTLTGNNQRVINGYNNVKVVISTANKATAINGASMVKYRAVCGTISAEANYSSDSEVQISLDYITSQTIDVYAIDSRGKSKKVSTTISSSNWKAYVNPTLTSAYAIRQSSLGTETTLSINGTFWNASFGSTTNTFDYFRYRYKKTTESSYGSWNNITPTKSSNNYSFSANINGDQGSSGFDTSYAYNIHIHIKDKIREINEYVVLRAGAPLMAMHRQGVAFGAPYDTTQGGALQIQGKNVLNMFFPVNSVYVTETNTNPGTFLGGTWTALRTLYGGELLAFGSMYSTGTGKTMKTTYDSFSNIIAGAYTSDIYNYGPTVLQIASSCMQVNIANIVGFVDVDVMMSGNGNGTCYGIWCDNVNSNTLPSGVTLMGNPNYLLTTGWEGRYGGATFKYQYKVTATGTSSFFLNPKFYAYPSGAEFYPGSGGVRYGMNARVYSKGGTHYVWKRTA